MDPFPNWLAEVENDPVVADTTVAGLNIEAQGNLRAFSLSQQQVRVVTQDQVIWFVRAVVATRGRQITERFGRQHRMVFYCWFDGQTAQLRFSLVSASHGRLPFGCEVRKAEDLASVVSQFLVSPYHSGIPMEEFEQGKGVVETPSGYHELLVWAVQIPVTEPEQPVA